MNICMIESRGLKHEFGSVGETIDEIKILLVLEVVTLDNN